MTTRDYKQTRELMQRTSVLSDRISGRVCHSITNLKDTHKLNSLFDLHSKTMTLYKKLHQQYEDSKPQFLRDLWIGGDE